MKNVRANIRKRDLLFVAFFAIIFMNGFETGGYQASISTIRDAFGLDNAGMGAYASIELVATMIAPIVFGSLADRAGKMRFIRIFLVFQILSGACICLFSSSGAFMGGIFALGLTTSALQFIAIAATADVYPRTGASKIGYLTSMYSLGALVAPLIVRFYLGLDMTWRLLFALIALAALLVLMCVLRAVDKPREELPATARGACETENSEGKRFVLPAILLLCLIMLVYVGFENGFAFFIDAFMTDTFSSEWGKYAISVFWASMIPSRLLSGRFCKHPLRNLAIADVGLPICMAILALGTSEAFVLAMCFPLGFASGAIYPNVLALAVKLAGKKTATATGMITTATGIGGAAFTFLTGAIAQSFGIRLSLIVLGAFFILSMLAIIVLRGYVHTAEAA